MGYLGNKLQGKYHKDTFQTAVNMAWPAIVESFFIAFAGLVDSLMVSSLGSYAVAGSRCAAARRAEAGCGE